MKRPTIFISSTVYDFRDLRSSIKDYLELRGCNSRKRKKVFLPPPSKFREFHAALGSDAAYACEVILKTGLRHFEFQQFAAKWWTRVRSASGASSLMVEGKGRVERAVYVSAALTKRCDEYFRRHTQFVRNDGEPWTIRTLQARITTASKAIKCKEEFGFSITGHLLRHAFASWAFQRFSDLYRAGVIKQEPILLVQELLGHASCETTWGTYVHMFGSDTEGDPEIFSLGPIEELLNIMEVNQFPNSSSLTSEKMTTNAAQVGLALASGPDEVSGE